MNKPGITAASIIREAKAIGADEALSGSQEDWEAIEEECKERTKKLQKKLKDLLTTRGGTDVDVRS